MDIATPDGGLYELVRMLFGFFNAPAAFLATYERIVLEDPLPNQRFFSGRRRTHIYKNAEAKAP